MSFKKVSVILVLCALLLAVVGCGGGQKAEKWPKDKITVVIPFGAGGSVDTMFRSLSKYWEKELGVPIVIENRDGATGQIGTTYYMKLPVDGNTVLVGTQLYLSGSIELQNASYKLDDLAVINFQQFDPITLTVLEDSPYKTFDDLYKAIKENPGKLRFGTMFGGPLHIGGEILKEELGLDFKTVFYDNGNAFRTSLLGKHVDFIFGQANGDLALKGKVRVLALASDKKMDIWPDAPLFNDVLKKYNKTFPNLGSSRFIAVNSALKSKYPDRYKFLVESYKKAFENPEYQKFMKENGEIVVSNYWGPEKSQEINKEMHQIVVKYKDKLKKN